MYNFTFCCTRQRMREFCGFLCLLFCTSSVSRSVVVLSNRASRMKTCFGLAPSYFVVLMSSRTSAALWPVSWKCGGVARLSVLRPNFTNLPYFRSVAVLKIISFVNNKMLTATLSFQSRAFRLVQIKWSSVCVCACRVVQTVHTRAVWKNKQQSACYSAQIRLSANGWRASFTHGAAVWWLKRNSDVICKYTLYNISFVSYVIILYHLWCIHCCQPPA